MKILVTGGTGFIGKAFMQEICGKNFSGIILQRPGASTKLVDTNDFKVLEDPLDSSELAKIIEGHGIEGIVHLASCYIKRHTPQQIDELIESNVKFPARLIEAASLAKVRWFLNIGTIWQNYQNNTYNPVNLYAATKQSFQDILKYYEETSPIKIMTLKLSDTFGPNDTRPKILNLLNRAALQKSSLDMSGGEQKMDILFIEDVISGLLRAIEILNSQDAKQTNQVYCLRSTEQLSLRALSELFANVLEKEITANWGALPYAAREVMIPPHIDLPLPGWSPTYSLRAALEKTFIDPI